MTTGAEKIPAAENESAHRADTVEFKIDEVLQVALEHESRGEFDVADVSFGKAFQLAPENPIRASVLLEQARAYEAREWLGSAFAALSHAASLLPEHGLADDKASLYQDIIGLQAKVSTAIESLAGEWPRSESPTYLPES